MSNHSSIDWLISQLQKAQDFQRVLSQVSQASSASIDVIATAKKMHLEEMQDAYRHGTTVSHGTSEHFDNFIKHYFIKHS